MEILERWKQHFDTLLNRTTTPAVDYLENIPQHQIQHWMSLPPTYNEFQEAPRQIKANKARGPDNIPLELLKHAGQTLQTRLHLLMLRIWEDKHLPGDWRDANIVNIFKKGDKRQCRNYRGISLLSIAGKVLARIILRCLQILAEDILPESQCGFHSNRGTIDMIFCARQLQEKSKEQQRPLYFIFYDLEKAFDSVPRVAMWSILERFGCPPTLVSIIRSFHDDMIGKVVHKNHTTETFPITCGLKQGCVLAPTLFSIYLAAMLYQLPPDNPSIDMRYCIDGSLFNTARLRSARLTTVFSLNNLQFADDMAAVASSPEDLERSVRNFTSAYE